MKKCDCKDEKLGIHYPVLYDEAVNSVKEVWGKTITEEEFNRLPESFWSRYNSQKDYFWGGNKDKYYEKKYNNIN